MTIYFTIFLIPAVLAQNRVLNGLNGQWWVVLIAMLVGAAVFAAEYSKTKLVIVGEMLFADSKEEDFARVLIIYNLIGAAICEEYFSDTILSATDTSTGYTCLLAQLCSCSTTRAFRGVINTGSSTMLSNLARA